MKICPACGYPSIGMCAACMNFSADLLGSTMGALTARSTAAKLSAEQIDPVRPAAQPSVAGGDGRFGARAAGFGASAVVATA